MAENSSIPDAIAPPQGLTRGRRLFALCVVLSVSFAHFIATSSYRWWAGPSAYDSAAIQIRLLVALIAEVTSLLLLWFVLSEQGRTWRDIGWTLHWGDMLHGIGLIVASALATSGATMCFQLLYRDVTGHWLQSRPVQGMWSFGPSVLSILLAVVNPFFEEMIVRAYTMTEVKALGGSSTLAMLVSVLIQMSYHTYQGLLRGIGLTITFTLFSLYFSRKRRIAPVILAHLFSDVWPLVRASS